MTMGELVVGLFDVLEDIAERPSICCASFESSSMW